MKASDTIQHPEVCLALGLANKTVEALVATNQAILSQLGAEGNPATSLTIHPKPSEADYTKLQDEYDLCSEELEEMRQAYSALDVTSGKRIAELENALAQTTAQLNAEGKELARVRNENEDLKRQGESADKRMKEIEQRLGLTLSKMDALKKDQAALTERNWNLQSELQKAKEAPQPAEGDFQKKVVAVLSAWKKFVTEWDGEDNDKLYVAFGRLSIAMRAVEGVSA